MRGSRASRRTRFGIKGRRNKSAASPSSQRSVWLVNDDGLPKSPLSIERMTPNLDSNLSRVARVKPTCKTMARKRKDPPEDSFPFFIDKSPGEELVEGLLSRGRSLMNDSVIVIESPRMCKGTTDEPLQWPVQEPRRQDSVDTVDLCSEEEGERIVAVSENKLKKKREGISRKRRRLCTKSQVTHQPDVIVLDDEDESISRASDNNASVIIESKKVELPRNSPRHDSSSTCLPTSSETQIPEIPVPSLPSGSGSYFRSKYLNNPSSISIPQSKDAVHSISTNPGPSGSIHSGSNIEKPELPDTVGSNVFNPCGNVQQTGLRPIIIDGCNVAIAHGGNRVFSVRGLCICVEYFLRRGHRQVVALVPLHQRSKVSHQDRDVLESLKNDGHLVYTPSRFIDNRLISSYDDRYIVQYAAAVGGVIVSRDNYRDLLIENHAWRDTITKRLLMPTWVGDILMFPVDPLGKAGPSLDDFLQFPNK